MIYFDESIKILTLFSDGNTSLSYDYLINKSSLKTAEVKVVLGYLLYLNYIDLEPSGNLKLTQLGHRFRICFYDCFNETIYLLKRLRDSFPQALTKQQCAEGIPTTEFKEIMYFLKEKEYIQEIGTVTNQKVVRIAENGFFILDYYNTKSKLNQILD